MMRTIILPIIALFLVTVTGKREQFTEDGYQYTVFTSDKQVHAVTKSIYKRATKGKPLPAK